MLDTLQPAETAPASKPAITWHVLTCEYPPQQGGVSDHTFLVSQGLVSHGDEVHVWCPAGYGKPPEVLGVQVHTALGRFAPADLKIAGRELDRFPGPRRLLVQWVPHGFGYKSLNLPFCLWLRRRSVRHGDQVELIVHEPFLPFVKGNWRQNAAALVHRLMTLVLLQSARRIWVSTPAWEKALRPFDHSRRRPYTWLPVPSNVPVVEAPDEVTAVRAQYARGEFVLGHFGTFGVPITAMLDAIIPSLLQRASGASLLLMGGGGGAFRERLLRERPDLASRIHAAGHLDARDLSLHLSACDLLIQPYPDGVTTRRGTIMAALAHGRPTITTSGLLTEPFWAASGAIVLLPARDTGAFVESALSLLASPETRAELGQRAREFYQQRFAVERVVELLRGLDRPGRAAAPNLPCRVNR